MTFHDAVSAGKSRSAVREVRGRQVYRWSDGKIEIYSRRGRRWPRWCERLRRAWADQAHRDWRRIE